MLKQIIVKIRNEKLLTKRETFCAILILYLFFGLIMWLAGLFSKGMASKQTAALLLLQDFLADFTNVVGYSAKLDPYHNWFYSGPSEKAYPPLVYLIFYLFSGLVDIDQYYEANFFVSMYKDPLMIYMFMLIHIGIYVFIFESFRKVFTTKRFYAVGIAFLVLFSEPMLFSLERGNTVIVTMLFISVFLFNYDNKSKVMREIAILSLALAAAFKMTPAVLGLLLLTDRKNRNLAIRAIIYGVLLFGLPFFFLNDNPFRSGVQLIRNIQGNMQAYSRWNGVTLEACLWEAGIKIDQTILIVIKYLVCAFLIFGVFITKEKWKQVMMISLVLTTFPNHSSYYCILYMIPAFIVFLNEKQHKPVDWLIFIAALSILQPYQNRILHFISTGNCVLILCGVMIGYIIKELIDRKNGMITIKPIEST